jgi:hypothetical protein
MTDPKRLLEEGSALEANLLGSALEDAPRKGLDRKIQAALGMGAIAISTGTASTTAAAASKAAPVLVSLGIAKWAGIVAIGAGAVIGAATIARHEPAAPPTARVVPVAAAVPRAEAREVPTPVPASPVEQPAVLPTPVPVAPPIVANRSVETRAPATQEATRAEVRPEAPPLSSELTLMDQANAALDSGDANRAMTLLDRHDLEFLHGRLAPEALELRIRAYAQRRDDAKVAELGRAFLSRYPESPLVPRVRALLASSDRP